MKRLFQFALLLSSVGLWAQGANTITRTGTGAPVGSCSFIQFYVDSSNGDMYNCVAAAWHKIGGGASSSPLTTKGDLWGFSTLDTRVGVGADGLCLKADSTNANGVSYSACAGAATGYQTIQNATAAITQRTILNWTAGILCSDNAGATRSDCALDNVTAVAHKFFNSVASGALVLAQPDYGDLTGTPQLAQTLANASHKWLNSYSAVTGLFTQTQPDYSDLTGVPSTFAPSAHNILSASHGDTTTAAAVRGDGIFAIGATPTWQRLAHPSVTSGYFKWNGTDMVASTLAASGTGAPTACSNQVVTAFTLNADAAPTSTCTTVTSAFTSGTFAPNAHNLLSASHGDTVAASPVLGDTLYGNSTPNWTKLAGATAGGGGSFLNETEGVLSPPSAPTPTALTSGGSLGASTTYYFVATIGNPAGETTPSVEFTVTTGTCTTAATPNCSITVPQPTFTGNADRWNLYGADQSGKELGIAGCIGFTGTCTVTTGLWIGGPPPVVNTAANGTTVIPSWSGSTGTGSVVNQTNATINPCKVDTVVYADCLPGTSSNRGVQINEANALCTSPCRIVVSPGTITTTPDWVRGNYYDMLPGTWTLSANAPMKHRDVIIDWNGSQVNYTLDNGTYAFANGKDSAYSAMTCNVTNGSPTIKWTSGPLFTDLDPGDSIFINNAQYNIIGVNSNQSITISVNYPGTTNANIACVGYVSPDTIVDTKYAPAVIRNLVLNYTGAGTNAGIGGIQWNLFSFPRMENVSITNFPKGWPLKLFGSILGYYSDVKVMTNANGVWITGGTVAGYSFPSNSSAFYSLKTNQSTTASGQPLLIDQTTDSIKFFDYDAESNAATITTTLAGTANNIAFYNPHWERNGDSTAASADGSIATTVTNVTFYNDSHASNAVNKPAIGIIAKGVDVAMNNSTYLGSYTTSWDYTGATRGSVQMATAVGASVNPIGGAIENRDGRYQLGPSLSTKASLNLPSTMAAPTAAPTIACSNSGGSLAAATYFVKNTFNNTAAGETTASAESSCATTGTTGSVTVTAPVLPPNATGYTVYDFTSSNGEKQQAASANCVNITANCVITTVGAGAVVPGAATASAGPVTATANAGDIGVQSSNGTIANNVEQHSNVVGVTSLLTGTAPPACTAGTAGFWCGAEGTAFTNVASTAGIYPDSTSHEYMAKTNGASTAGMILRSQPGAIHVTGQTATKTIYTLCAASAGACNTAGQYAVDWYFNQGGTACSSVTAGSVTFALTWTDNAGAHSAVALPMMDQLSTTATSTLFHFTTSNTTAWASGHFNIWSTGAAAIQITNTYVACTTGTGTWELAATATRIQ